MTGFPTRGLWRHSSLLPEVDVSAVVSLGEGDTPLIDASGPTITNLPVGSIRMKAEYQNPTGSFKDRIATVAAALIRQGGLRGAVGTSSGNGGAAIAAYGARAGFPVVLFTLSGIVDGKLQQILAHGATTHLVERMGEDGAATDSVAPTIARMAEEARWLPFLTGARYLPEAMRGAETIAFELAEQHPEVDAVYIPVGGGGLLGSIWRGYQRLGVTPPRIVGAQPAGCPTLSRALAGDRTPLPDRVSTTISGLQVPVLFDFGAIDAVESTGGHVVEVTDERVWDTQRLLAREEGVFVEPAGATALAGVLADVARGRLEPDADVVAVLSGAGHKDSTAVARLAEGNTTLRVPADRVEAAFNRLQERV
jgi:threonine synthase